jgi:BNR/Asp-box repeat
MFAELAGHVGLAVRGDAGVGLLVAGCGGREDSDEQASPGPKVGDPGPVHVHGLGINPADRALFIATHTGLFRAGEGEPRATRVGGRFQDTMGFTVVGPNDFLGSGHPDGREKLPSFLGLIRSQDAGKRWRPISLLGKRDFHVLEAAGERIYGFGSDFDTREQGFLISDDGGRSWSKRAVPEPLIALALDPKDPDRLLASGEHSLYLSQDAGRRWLALSGSAGLVAWSDRVVVVDGDGAVSSAERPGARLRPVGEVGGKPAALESGPRRELYVALHDGTVKRSSDGGRKWHVRSRP